MALRFVVSRALRGALCGGIFQSIERPGGRSNRLSRFDQSAPVRRRDRPCWERERKVVWAKDNLVGARHPVPTNASSHGCGWPAAFRPHRAPWIGPRVTTASSFADTEAGKPGLGRDLFRCPSGTAGSTFQDSFAAHHQHRRPPTTVGAGTRSIVAPMDLPAGSPLTGPMPGSTKMAPTCLRCRRPSLRRTLDERRISDRLQAAFLEVGIDLSPHSFIQVTQPGRRWHLVVPGITYTLKSGRAAVKGLRWIHRLGKRVAQLGATLCGLGRALRLSNWTMPSTPTWSSVPKSFATIDWCSAWATTSTGLRPCGTIWSSIVAEGRQPGILQRQQSLVAGSQPRPGTGDGLLEGLQAAILSMAPADTTGSPRSGATT